MDYTSLRILQAVTLHTEYLKPDKSRFCSLFLKAELTEVYKKEWLSQ